MIQVLGNDISLLIQKSLEEGKGYAFLPVNEDVNEELAKLQKKYGDLYIIKERWHQHACKGLTALHRVEQSLQRRQRIIQNELSGIEQALEQVKEVKKNDKRG